MITIELDENMWPVLNYLKRKYDAECVECEHGSNHPLAHVVSSTLIHMATVGKEQEADDALHAKIDLLAMPIAMVRRVEDWPQYDFPNDAEIGNCSACGEPCAYRPDLPPDVRKVCSRCLGITPAGVAPQASQTPPDTDARKRMN